MNNLAPTVLNEMLTVAVTDGIVNINLCGIDDFQFRLHDVIGDAETTLEKPLLLKTIHKYADLHVPVTVEETHMSGRKVYTHEGWKTMVKREYYNKAYTSPYAIPSAPITPAPNDFTVNIHDGVLTVGSVQAIPHESISHGLGFLQEIVKDYYDLVRESESAKIIINANPNLPVIIGHERPIRRLSEELMTNHAVITPGMLDIFLEMTR